MPGVGTQKNDHCKDGEGGRNKATEALVYGARRRRSALLSMNLDAFWSLLLVVVSG